MSSAFQFKNSSLSKKIFDALKTNLNGPFKRIEADENGSMDIYKNILTRSVLDELSDLNGHEYLNWGSIIENSDGNEEVVGGTYKGKVIQIGLRWAVSDKDWTNVGQSLSRSEEHTS